MSERTALEIADSLEVEMLSLKNADDAAEMLRSQADEACVNWILEINKDKQNELNI